MDVHGEFLLLLLVAVLLLSAFLVCHFASPNTSLLIKTFVVLSFGLGFAGIALLPVDLTITTVYSDQYNQKITPNATYAPWQLTYWSTFLLDFVFLPLIRESLLSGHFTVQSHLQAGCQSAIQGYLLLLVLGVFGVTFMIIRLHSWRIVVVLMAIGNTYGLLLRFKLRMLGVQLDGSTIIFCDSETVFKNTSLPVRMSLLGDEG
jgi:hypothetical protein